MEKSLKSNTKTNSKIVVSFSVFYVVITLAVYILPAAQFALPYIPVALLMLASFFLLMIQNKKWWTWGVILLFFTAMVFLANFTLNGWSITEAINDSVRNVRYFTPVIWSFWAIKNFEKKQCRTVLVVFLLITAFICIRSLEAFVEEPMISRILAQDKTTSSDEINAYRLRNVGGYSFSYMMGVVTIALAWLSIKRVKKTLPRLLCIAGLVVCYYYIIQAMYMTLLLVTSVAMLLLVFSNVKNIFTKFLLVIGTIVLVFLLPNIFEFLSDIFNGTILSSKFSDMHDALTGEGAEALGIRPQLMADSLKNWLKTPFFGGIYETHSHSTLFGILQDNGLFGLAGWLCVYIISWRLIRHTLISKNVDPKLFDVAMIYLSAISIFNDTRYTFDITISTFFIIPLLLSWFGQYHIQGKKKDEYA